LNSPSAAGLACLDQRVRLDPFRRVERVVTDLAIVAIVLGAVDREDDREHVLGNDRTL
jgi:hypothetical protein